MKSGTPPLKKKLLKLSDGGVEFVIQFQVSHLKILSRLFLLLPSIGFLNSFLGMLGEFASIVEADVFPSFISAWNLIRVLVMMLLWKRMTEFQKQRQISTGCLHILSGMSIGRRRDSNCRLMDSHSGSLFITP